MKILQKVLVLSLVCMFFMSMTSANRVLLKDDPFQECQDLADLDFDFHQDYNSAAAVYNLV